MTHVVEIGGFLFGPFPNAIAAHQWAEFAPQLGQNAFRPFTVRELREPPAVLSPGEQQEKACFPNGR